VTNRSDIRISVRRRLEDTGVNPLWDDAALNDFIGDSIRRYGVRFPAERSVIVVAGSPATSLPVTPAIDAIQIVLVIDPAGDVVPRQIRTQRDNGQGGLPTAQAWRWWNQTLLLAQPAALGDWRIDYLGGRLVPPDDVAAIDVNDGDEEIVIVMTAGTALRRRAIENGKRGDARAAMEMEQAAAAFDSLARQRIAGRVRRIRGGWFS
jgi:hypothetical protein